MATLSAYKTFSIAHTAQCKLHMSSKDPDRNLRFMLGHAFLLDKALFRVAEMEVMADEEPAAAEVGKGALGNVDADEKASNVPPEGQKGSLAGGSVSFKGDSTDDLLKNVKKVPDTTADKNDKVAGEGTRRESTASDEEREAALAEYNDDDAEDGEGFDLTRYVSASHMPPRMIPDEGDDVAEEDEAISPPLLPADFDVAGLVQGPENEEMGEMYELVRTCRCHGQTETAQKGKRFWEVQDPAGSPNKRLAVMEVEA